MSMRECGVSYDNDKEKERKDNSIVVGNEPEEERKTGAILWMCMCVFRRNKENVAGERERKENDKKKIKTALLHSHGK